MLVVISCKSLSQLQTPIHLVLTRMVISGGFPVDKISTPIKAFPTAISVPEEILQTPCTQ